MKKELYQFDRLRFMLFCIALALFGLFSNHVSGQERIVPQTKYERELKKDGCGDQLNKKGIKLQEEGLDLFFVQGKTSEAAKLLRKAIKLEPRLIPSYQQLSFYYQQIEHKPKEAIALLEKGIKHCPRAPLLYFSLANCYAHIDRHEEAINYYDTAEQLGMEINPSFFYNRGNSYAKLGKYGEAIADYKRSVDLDPGKLNAWRSLAISYYRYGDKQSASKCAKTLLKLDPEGRFGLWAKDALQNM